MTGSDSADDSADNLKLVTGPGLTVRRYLINFHTVMHMHKVANLANPRGIYGRDSFHLSYCL